MIRSILSKYLQSHSKKEAASFFNLSERTIIRLTKKFNIKTNQNYKQKLDYDKAQEIRNLFNTGNYNCTEIAKLYSVSLPSITNIIRNKTYKMNNIVEQVLGGSAQVSVTYNPPVILPPPMKKAVGYYLWLQNGEKIVGKFAGQNGDSLYFILPNFPTVQEFKLPDLVSLRNALVHEVEVMTERYKDNLNEGFKLPI